MSREREEKRLKIRVRWAERSERVKWERRAGPSMPLTAVGLCFNVERKAWKCAVMLPVTHFQYLGIGQHRFPFANISVLCSGTL